MTEPVPEPATELATEPAGPQNAPRGGRRQAGRERRARERERRRFWLIVMPSIAIALGIVVAIGVLLRGASETTNDGGSKSQVPALTTEAALIAHVGATNGADLILLLGRSGDSGSVLMLPSSTQVEVPSLGIQTLAQVPSVGDDSLLQTTVQNLTGVNAGAPSIVDDATLLAAITPAAPFEVDLRRSVRFAADKRDAFPVGLQSLTAEQISRLLTEPQVGSEVDRLVTVQAVLEGWMKRLKSPAVARATIAAVPIAAPIASVAGLRPASFDTLPVDSIGTSGDERLSVRASALPGVVKRLFPAARLGIGGKRPRIEILNGVGTVGLAQAVSRLVVPIGGDVRLTGNVPDFGVTETQVIYYRDADRRAAEKFLKAIGVGSLRRADREVGIADVTIIVGPDFNPKGSTK
jgi:hypothetical protein